MSDLIQYPEALMPLLFRWSRIVVGLERGGVASLPDLGIDLVAAGYDTPPIIALAVSDRFEYSPDLMRTARRAFASLGVLDEEDPGFHLLVASRSVATRIVDGTLPAEEGLRQVAGLWTNAHYPELLSEWIMLEESIYFAREFMGKLERHTDLTEAKIPETIRTLARKFLSENPVILHPP